MATIKLTLENRHPYSDGRFPVIFRLTSNRKTTAIYTDIKVFQNEWDLKGAVNKTHPNYKSINLQLKKRHYELEKKLLEITSQQDELEVVDLKNTLLGKGKRDITFYEFATKEIQTLRDQQRFGNADAYETAVNRLVKFTDKNITLDKINYRLITDFDAHLIKEGLSKNSVAVYMREIRALLNKAIKEELLDKNKYPFSSYTIRTEKTISRAVTKTDLVKIKELPLDENSKLWHSRNIFFLIFNLIGISFIDLALLKHSSIQHGRVVYKRRKTHKIYSVKLTSEAQRILNIYKNDKSEYLLAHLELDDLPKDKAREVIRQSLCVYNKYLKRLGELCELEIDLTTYVARYTWANVAKALGYSKDLIAESLGHNYGNSVTGIYLDNYGNEVIDDINEKVTQFLTH